LRYLILALSVLGTAGPTLSGALARPAAPPRGPQAAHPTGVATYERRILPLFRGRCIGCHGAGQPEAGLDVRTRGDLVQGGHSGPAVVPGAPEQSLLYQMLRDGRMPKGGRKLGPGELQQVEQWIRAGAPGATGAGGHWAFRSPVQPPLPEVRTPGRVRNPVDRFLLAALERRGLSLSPDADRRTLLRRVTYDLIGLPPTPAEVEGFLADRRSDAYERVVDGLLSDPRYGERWARHWLDAAGYADSEGVLQEDRLRPDAWRYRDYVIRSFNEDKPYDVFLREQIAGDELVDYRSASRFTPELVDTLAATGFLRTAVDATRDDFNPHQYGEYQYRMLHDVQTIVVSATLGLTLHCARCHDHKYEPLSQKDYYRVQALFMGAVRPRGALLPTNRRQIVAATAAEQERVKQMNAAVAAALRELDHGQAALVREFRARYLEAKSAMIPETERPLLREAAALDEGKRSPEQKALVARHRALVEAAPDQLAAEFPDFKQRQAELQAARAAEERKRIALPTIRAFYDQDANPPATPLLIRGDWLRPGEAVAPGIPAVLDDPRLPFAMPASPPGGSSTGRRNAFAAWLTRPDHPLTARVLVNRVWAHHFGAGLVPSLENFGRSGTPPTNPALLDWLACYFVGGNEETGKWGNGGDPKRAAISSFPHFPISSPRPWSIKALHRLILTSSAYRQGSGWRAEGARIDPENRLLWRQRPRRLEAEAIRDAMLAVSGTLDPRMFGEPVGTETRATGEIVAAGEEKGGRRSVYLQVRRSLPVTLLNTFDAPVMETNCTRRTVSVTATQALALMNGSFVTSQAGHLARRVLKERPPGEDPAGGHPATVRHAYQLAFSRPPSPAEGAATLDFLREQEARYRGAGKAARAALEQAYADFCQALLSANEFIYVD
jgi:mono/diheme cytochrome c family protein